MTSSSRKLQPLCPRCGTNLVPDGYRNCDRCRATRRELKRFRFEQGLCKNCPKPTAPGKRYCPACAARAGGNISEATVRKRELGLCWWVGCTSPATVGRACKVHKARNQLRKVGAKSCT